MIIFRSQTFAKTYFENFHISVNILTRRFQIIDNFLHIHDQLRKINSSYRNFQRNVKNWPNVISVDNANEILIENFKRLIFSLEEHFLNPVNILSKIRNLAMNPCRASLAVSSKCHLSESSSGSEETELVDVERRDDDKNLKPSPSDCFHIDQSEMGNTRVESIEKMMVNFDELQTQIELIEEEKERMKQEIETKKSKILEALLKLIEFEGMIEDIEGLIADQLNLFQVRIISLEHKLMENFNNQNDADIQQLYENEIESVKMSHVKKSKKDEDSYEDLTKKAKTFAASIGNVIEEYRKFHDESNENFAHNIEMLTLLITRPAQFCRDSNNQRFYLNNEKVKIYQANRHSSEYMLNVDDGSTVKIKEGLPLENDERGEFYVDIRSRKIYTKYFFADEHGRYYIDINGDRHYQTDAKASEYALVNGSWVKTKEGTYEVDAKGLRVSSKIDVSSSNEHEGDSDDDLEALINGKSSKRSKKLNDDDMKYIKENLGTAIVKACAATFHHRPADPVNYFANFLLHYRFNEEMFKKREKELKYFIEFREQMKKESNE